MSKDSNDISIKEELLRLAFAKIKLENQILNEKISLLERRLVILENQKVKTNDNKVMAQKPKKSEDKKTENIEKAKASLSPSEKEILHLFTMSKDKSYTYEEIGAMLGKSSNTVKAQIQSIIKKGIKVSFMQQANNQRSYFLDNLMFELVVKTKN